MNALLENIRTAAQKRALYRRTVTELSNIPLDVALDLDIYHGDIPRIARRAIYGI